ncbi:hypothetical protein [uncultured Desulfuromusa sp.]|uniref:hypothetical protein n=1 Tax=uncultured Desulfuromusa sp. TaxID=219183 RepID=UPI002AA60FC7|nr:hypothetical protein [uncultured Desulfuromusa sp.]
MASKTTECKACKKEVSKTAKTCPHCGEKRPGTKPGDTAKGCLVFLVIGIIFAIGLTFCSDEDPDKDRSIMAGIQCQHVVKEYLKSPATADFPFGPPVQRLNKSDYRLDSYVDAQNGFGATTRTTFRCDIQYKGGDPANLASWSVLAMEID